MSTTLGKRRALLELSSLFLPDLGFFLSSLCMLSAAAPVTGTLIIIVTDAYTAVRLKTPLQDLELLCAVFLLSNLVISNSLEEASLVFLSPRSLIPPKEATPQASGNCGPGAA